MSNLNIKNKIQKNNTVYTPEKLSYFIYKKITKDYNFKTIYDPCIGKGGMTKYFFENDNYKVIGSDIENVGQNYCHEFYNQDIKNLNINIKPDCVIMNVPFNGNGRGKNLLFPHLFLKTIFDKFGEDMPVVMITGDNFLNNNSLNSKRLKYISDGSFKITSITTLPLNVFEGIKFNAQVLYFNMDKLQPYDIFDISKVQIPLTPSNNTTNPNTKVA